MRKKILKKNIFFYVNMLFEDGNYDIFWKRPYQIVSNPVFIDDDSWIDDLAREMLGNCCLH